MLLHAVYREIDNYYQYLCNPSTSEHDFKVHAQVLAHLRETVIINQGESIIN